MRSISLRFTSPFEGSTNMSVSVVRLGLSSISDSCTVCVPRMTSVHITVGAYPLLLLSSSLCLVCVARHIVAVAIIVPLAALIIHVDVWVIYLFQSMDVAATPHHRLNPVRKWRAPLLF